MKTSVNKRYRPVVAVLPTIPKFSGYHWKDYLENILCLGGQSGTEPDDSCCSRFVVPVHCFHQALLAEYMKYIRAGIKVEVTTDETFDAIKDTSIKSYWIARIIRIAGYRLLLRYEGMDEPGDLVHDFWVNIGSDDIKNVGFCAEDTTKRALVPPREIQARISDWTEYIHSKLHAYKTIALSWQDIQRRKLSACKFKKEDHLELIDSSNSVHVRPARVEKIVGRRILVKVMQKYLDSSPLRDFKYTDNGQDDIQLDEGVWMDQDSPVIFYVGWSLRVGYNLSASDEYRAHAQEIAYALKTGSGCVPYVKRDTAPSLFDYHEKVSDSAIHWEKGTKLEVLDPLDNWKELRVATVLDILEDGYLKIGFDGEELEQEPVPLHCSSPLLFPVGYAAKYSLKLKGPNEGESFDWGSYLHETNSRPADENLFSDFDENVLDNFKIGAKLEAVDMCEPQLICPATVVGHHGRLLRIRYDGWDDSYDQLFDYRSPNIFPLGWCEMHGYTLEAPKIDAKKEKI